MDAPAQIRIGVLSGEVGAASVGPAVSRPSRPALPILARARNRVHYFRRHDEAQLDAQYAVHQDEDQLIQTTRQAADPLKELFEADAVQEPLRDAVARR